MPEDCHPGGSVRGGMHDRLHAGSKVSVNAAVHLACARKIITRVDLDGPVLCSEDPVEGGAVFNEKEITVSDAPGLGVTGIQGIRYLDD